MRQCDFLEEAATPVAGQAQEAPEAQPGARKAHAELCAVAVKWLKRPHSAGGPGCMVAVSEVAGGWTGEIPDAIGFSQAVPNDGSVVVEVKVSRSDFLADKKKPHRQPGQGMGTWRYYMAPEGLIAVDELPAGWGLIEVNKRGHTKVLAGGMRDCKNMGYGAMLEQANAWRQQGDVAREQWLLVRLLARLGDVECLNQKLREAYRERAEIAKRADYRLNEVRDLNRENHRLKRMLAAAGIDWEKPETIPVATARKLDLPTLPESTPWNSSPTSLESSL